MNAKIIYLLCLGVSLFASGEAAFKIKQGKLIDADDVATLPVQEHYNHGLAAMEAENWKAAAQQFRIITLSFPSSAYASDSYYYLGVAEFYLDELDFANDAFSAYLKAKNNPRYFQETIEYKYAIADKLSLGYKRRFFGTKKLPKWASGKSLALEIYDEVIGSLPCHDLAARALYSKGILLWNEKQYKKAVDAFQMVVKRFPKHELAPESYIAISKVYLEQSQSEFQNSDILEFAKLNSARFQHDFPRDERIVETQADVLAGMEIYAKGLYDTGQFYERIEKPKASVIYYQNAIKKFPDTEIAKLCANRLEALGISTQ